MTTFDTAEVAGAVAEIASRTHEPDIARELMELVDRLLAGAGMPDLPTAEADQLGSCLGRLP